MSALRLPASFAVEGPTDEAVLRAVAGSVNLELMRGHGSRGKAYLRARLGAFNAAARHAPWVVLVDLDTELECAPRLLATWLPHREPGMGLCVAVRAVEAWLLADAERLATFLGVHQSAVPSLPDEVDDPKAEMLRLVRRSRRTALRHDMLPRPESGIAVGPAYAGRLIEFASRHWRPEVAECRSDSLRRCRARLTALGSGTETA
ncbi:MAG: hypothetical protein IT208_10770 [Chthonomonadales bacterium]|nr:hypothetical protein [Chthonomonadales bacterium]